MENIRSYLRTPTGLLAFSAISGWIFYCTWVFSSFYHPDADVIISILGLILFNLSIAGLGLAIWRDQRWDRRLRRAWILIAIGALGTLGGDFIYIYLENVLSVDPFPSLADLFYSIYYPFTLAGLLHLPFAPSRPREQAGFWVDLAIVMVGCGMFFWFYLLAPVLLQSGPTLNEFVAIAYPVGDLMILTGLVVLIQRDFQKVSFGSLFFLSLGALFTCIADSLFAYFDTNQVNYSITNLNVLWMASALCDILAAAIQILVGKYVPETIDARLIRPQQWLRLGLPYLVVGSGLYLMFFVVNSYQALNLQLRGLLYGSLLLLGLVFLRQYLVLRENVALYEEMKIMAMTDSLTQLNNRHYFNEAYLDIFRRCQDNSRSLAVLVADVDGFKKINDRFGHLSGDEVLKMVARILASQLRSTDLVARFGGDEFVILLPDADQGQAEVVAGRIREAVKNNSVPAGMLGASVGIAMLKPEITPEQLLDQADRALYIDKTRGCEDRADPC